MDAYEAIMTRRSTRAFRGEQLDPEALDKVIQAGRFAPSGGNSQTTRFLVVRDRALLAELAAAAEKAFAAMEVTEDMYRSLKGSILQAKKGGYVYHYDPATLIITANKKDYSNNIADCACALENMMIMASALDLGSCWINQLKWLNEDPELLAILRRHGLEEDERVYGALAVGLPATQDGHPQRTPLPRTGNPVIYI